MNNYNIEKYESIIKYEEKVLKYILYRKRTENEVRFKFKNDIQSDILNLIIDKYKKLGYINDKDYIEAAIKEKMLLGNYSIKELKYKMMQKWVDKEIIQNYFLVNNEFLEKFEYESCEKLFLNKLNQSSFEKAKMYILRKGYLNKTLNEVIKNNAEIIDNRK